MGMSRGQTSLAILVVLASLVGTGLLVSNTNKQEADAKAARATITKLATQKKNAKVRPTIIKKGLPSKYQQAKNAANQVMKAQLTYSKSFYGMKGSANGNNEYRNAKAVMSTLVDNRADWKPAETPWVKNPDWVGTTEFEGPTGDGMYPVAFVYKDKKNELMAIIQTEFDTKNHWFTNISTFGTKKGADSADKYSNAHWKEGRVNVPK